MTFGSVKIVRNLAKSETKLLKNNMIDCRINMIDCRITQMQRHRII